MVVISNQISPYQHGPVLSMIHRFIFRLHINFGLIAFHFIYVFYPVFFFGSLFAYIISLVCVCEFFFSVSRIDVNVERQTKHLLWHIYDKYFVGMHQSFTKICCYFVAFLTKCSNQMLLKWANKYRRCKLQYKVIFGWRWCFWNEYVKSTEKKLFFKIGMDAVVRPFYC